MGTSAQTYHFEESYRWVHFTTESGLPSNQTSTLYEASDSTIWVSTSKGPAWYNGYRWIMLHTENGKPITDDVQIAEFHDSVCLATRSGILLGKKAGFHPIIKNVYAQPVSITKDSLFIVRDGTLQLFTDGAMRQCDISPISKGSFLYIWKTSSGSLWARTTHAGYQLRNGVFTLVYSSPNSEASFTWSAENKNGTGMFSISSPEERRGLWEWTHFSPPKHTALLSAGEIINGDIRPNGDAIVVFNSGEIQYKENGIWRTMTLRDGSNENIRTVKFDSKGNIWFATSNGIYLYRAMRQEWTLQREQGPDLKNDINEILIARNGTRWLASSYGIGIQQDTGKTNYISSINGTSIYGVTALAEDDSGRIWIGSGGSFSGTYRFDGKQWKHFDISDTEVVFVHKIRKDRNGRLWFLGLGKYSLDANAHQPGAFVYSNNTFTRWGKEEGLLSGRVYCFAEGNKGTFWFGTSAGLCKWKQGFWKYWKLDEKILINPVFSLTVGRDGNIWGTCMNDDHLFWLGQDDSVHLVNPEYRTSEYASDLKFDSTGMLWAATTNGLLSYNGELWTHYDRKTGLQKEALQTVLPTSKKIYCGTDGFGLAVLERDALYVPPPIVALSRPTVDGYSALIQWIAYPYLGELPMEDIATRFRVNNQDWSQWSKQHFAQLENLQPGNYTIQVQAKGTHGNINRLGQYATFVIEQPLLLRPIVLYPLSLTGGMVIFLLGIIFVRRRAHARELAVSEEKFRSVVTTTTSAIFVHRNGRIIFFNPYSLELTGFKEEEMREQSFYDLIHANDEATLREFERQWLTEPTVPKRFECMIVTKSNDIRWWDVTSAKVLFQDQYAIFVTAFDITDKKNAEERTKALTTELIQTEDRERRRMAVYLHDIIGQHLAVGKMKLRSLLKSNPALEIGQELQDIREHLDLAIKDSRTLTFELSPPALQDIRFFNAIETLGAQIFEEHSISYTVHHTGDEQPIPPEMRVLLYYVIREIMFNILKHANANRVELTMNFIESMLQIVIEDDGSGFDMNEVLNRKRSSSGFGLHNVRERLTQIGATFEIDSEVHKGTRVTMSVPVGENG